MADYNLKDRSGPWVHFLDQQKAHLPVVTDKLGITIKIDGKDMKNLDSLFARYAEIFRFPSYFGGNWPAFNECITDLSDLPAKAYLTIITEADCVLQSEPAELPTFIKHLQIAGHSWANSFGKGPEWGSGEVPFNTVFSGNQGPLFTLLQHF
ncbi:barstar family protein [Nakamurella antarctica]|nr:barstar family protein [Nakamurella antarctica]